MVQPYVRAARRYRPAEIEADFAVHRVGMFVGAIASAVLLALAASANLTTLWSVLAYIVGLLAMLGLSAAYHLHRSSERRVLLRSLDHAAIFVLSAGPHTLFTPLI